MIFFRKKNDANALEILFEGGLGAQILQAATFFDMQQSGQIVASNFSYFKSDEVNFSRDKQGSKLEKVFIKRPWNLDLFNITINDIKKCSNNSTNIKKVIASNAFVLEQGIKALKKNEIKKLFSPQSGKLGADNSIISLAEPFICVHMRRGDYLKVATHIISDNEFLGIAKSFNSLVKTALFISDSPIEPNFRKSLHGYFESTHFLDSIDPLYAHDLMRKAKILICSNSTFSLTAALLGENNIKIIPKTWFGKKNEVELQELINSNCDFQVLA